MKRTLLIIGAFLFSITAFGFELNCDRDGHRAQISVSNDSLTVDGNDYPAYGLPHLFLKYIQTLYLHQAMALAKNLEDLSDPETQYNMFSNENKESPLYILVGRPFQNSDTKNSGQIIVVRDNPEFSHAITCKRFDAQRP